MSDCKHEFNFKIDLVIKCEKCNKGFTVGQVIDHQQATIKELEEKLAALALIDSVRLAELFHTLYEKLAPDFNYKTRERSAVDWIDVPEDNKSLMIAVAAKILDRLRLTQLGE